MQFELVSLKTPEASPEPTEHTMAFPTPRRLVVLLLMLLTPLSHSRRAHADPDSLSQLLSQAQCKDWRQVSKLTSERLRNANDHHIAVDLKIIEVAFGFLDFCAGEFEIRLANFKATGLEDSEDTAQRATRSFAALIVYYREALNSTAPAKSLASWSAISQMVGLVQPELIAIIERRFGQGAFSRYFDIEKTPEKDRNMEARNLFASMRPWMEPL
jgi:hypothetical protein